MNKPFIMRHLPNEDVLYIKSGGVIMFKNLFLAIVLIVVILSFISCTELPETEQVPVAQRLSQAEEALNEGNDTAAEILLNQVLNADPTNPKANIGMGFINLLKGNRKILTLIEEMTTDASATTSPRALSPLNFILQFDFSKFQTDINSIVTDLEDSKSEFETALAYMTPTSTLTVYPNRFDWNQDGFTDPVTPLNLSFDPRGDGETRLWWVLFDHTAPLSGNRGIFDETKRGDAWFDTESIRQLFNDGSISPGYEPVFDENDFYTLRAIEVKILLTFVDMELSILEPLLIWDLNPDTELTDWLSEASNTHDEYDNFLDYATTTIDLDQNGTMTNTEIRTIMPTTFLSFYAHANGGLNAISDWASALTGFSELGLELYNDGFLDFLPFDPEDVLINVGKAVSDSTYKIQIGSSSPFLSTVRITPLTTYETFLIPYNFFSQPGNFDDLKDFLPEIGYQNFIINFPDETFGGIIEKIPSVAELIRRFID